MRAIPRLLLGTILCCTACAPGLRSASADPGPYGVVEEPPGHAELAAYGAWVDESPYGPVWRPAVATGWRPYSVGTWAWTADGWTWVSAEPWGWTFHYGRWAVLPYHGWVWVPGTVWGPAWVDWYWDDGWVGWAPLGPPGAFVGSMHHYVFVNERDFCSPRLRPILVDHWGLPWHVRHGWGHRHRHRPSYGHIERVSRHRVRRVAGRPRDGRGPRRRPGRDVTPPDRGRGDGPRRGRRGDAGPGDGHAVVPREPRQRAWGGRRGQPPAERRDARPRRDDGRDRRRQTVAPDARASSPSLRSARRDAKRERRVERRETRQAHRVERRQARREHRVARRETRRETRVARQSERREERGDRRTGPRGGDRWR